MSKKAKDFRKRLSLQNQNVGKNKLNDVLGNMGLDKPEEEKEVTEEEDPLKYFSQKQRKKEKEEEAKKYLKPILEEEDPLKYFDKKKAKEAEDEDPLNFVKKKTDNEYDIVPKMLGIISEELDENILAEKIKNNDIPEEVNIEKKNNNSKYSMEERKKKMEKRYKTSLRLTQRKGFEARAKDKLMQRLQNYKNVVNASDTIKTSEKNPEKKNTGNTLLSAEEQVSNINTNNTVKTKKDIDLSSFMKKKDDK